MRHLRLTLNLLIALALGILWAQAQEELTEYNLNISTAESNSNAFGFTAYNGDVYFFGADMESSWGLYQYDGSTATKVAALGPDWNSLG